MPSRTVTVSPGWATSAARWIVRKGASRVPGFVSRPWSETSYSVAFAAVASASANGNAARIMSASPCCGPAHPDSRPLPRPCRGAYSRNASAANLQPVRLDTHQHFWRYDPAQHVWMTDAMGVLAPRLPARRPRAAARRGRLRRHDRRPGAADGRGDRVAAAARRRAPVHPGRRRLGGPALAAGRRPARAVRAAPEARRRPPRRPRRAGRRVHAASRTSGAASPGCGSST